METRKFSIILGGAALVIILLIGSMIVFGRDKEGSLREDFIPEQASTSEAWLPPTEEDRETVRSFRQGPLQNLGRDIPEGSGYAITYEDSETPRFLITIDASAWPEFFRLQRLAFEEFRKKGVDPCTLPLWSAIATEVRDWRSFDFSLDTNKNTLVPCGE